MGNRVKPKQPPHWLIARFGGGVCSGEDCNEPIRKGDRVFYNPKTKAIYATTCGHAHEEMKKAIRREIRR